MLTFQKYNRTTTFLFFPPETAFAVINQFCFAVVFNVSVLPNTPGRHNCGWWRSHLMFPTELGAQLSYGEPRLSINQGVCMLSPGFYHSDTDASIFLVVQTFSPTQPYMMNVLFPFDFVCKWSEVSMQCPPATNLVIITPEMSTVLCVGWSLSSRSVHSKDF